MSDCNGARRVYYSHWHSRPIKHLVIIAYALEFGSLHATEYLNEIIGKLWQITGPVWRAVREHEILNEENRAG